MSNDDEDEVHPGDDGYVVELQTWVFSDAARLESKYGEYTDEPQIMFSTVLGPFPEIDSLLKAVQERTGPVKWEDYRYGSIGSYPKPFKRPVRGPDMSGGAATVARGITVFHMKIRYTKDGAVIQWPGGNVGLAEKGDDVERDDQWYLKKKLRLKDR